MRGNYEAQKVIREHVEKHPEARDMPGRTLARALYAKHPEVWPSLEAARHAVGWFFGQAGKGSKRYSKNKRPARTPGEDWEQYLPESWREPVEWEPFLIHGANRTLVISDQQVPFHDELACKISIRYGLDHGANLVLLNGDVVDSHWLSKYIKDPRLRDFPEEVRLGIQYLNTIRKAFPDARIIYKHGNHEERYQNYMRTHSPELLGVPEFSWEHIYHLDDYGIEIVTDKRPIELGKLNVYHGHEIPTGGVMPARTLFNKAMESSLAGHVHRSHHFSEPTASGKLISTWTTGCLCQLHPEFARINKWNHGFALVEVSDDGAFRVENLRIVDGKAW